MQQSTLRLTKAVLTDQLPPSPLRGKQRFAVDRMYARHQEQSAQIIQSAFEDLFAFFESRKLYVLYEDALHCDPLTDHLQPKSVLPIFYDELQRLKRTITGRLGLSALVGFEDVLSSVFSEQADENAGLLLQQQDLSAESAARLALARSLEDMLESERAGSICLRSQRTLENLKVGEQLRQLARGASAYAPDFPEYIAASAKQARGGSDDTTALAETSRLNEQVVMLQAKNLQLARENQRLATQRDELQFTSGRGDATVAALEAEVLKLQALLRDRDAALSDHQKRAESIADAQNAERAAHNAETAQNMREAAAAARKLRECEARLQEAFTDATLHKQLVQQLEVQLSQLSGAKPGLDAKTAAKPGKGAGKDEIARQLQMLRKQPENAPEDAQNNQEMRQFALCLFKEQAAGNAAYFGLDDAQLVQRMRQNGDLRVFASTIRQNFFASNAEIQEAVAGAARAAEAEFKAQSDVDVLRSLRETRRYDYYREIARKRAYCSESVLVSAEAIQSADTAEQLPFSTPAGVRAALFAEIQRMLRFEAQHDTGAEVPAHRAQTRVSCGLQSQESAEVPNKRVAAQFQQDIDAAVDAVAHLTSLHAYACGVVGAVSGRQFSGQAAGLWPPEAPRRDSDVARPSSGVSGGQSTTGVQNRTTSQQGSRHAAADAENTYLRESELFGGVSGGDFALNPVSALQDFQFGESGQNLGNPANLARIGQRELHELLRRRAGVRDVFLRLFSDAEAYQQRLLQIRQRYFAAGAVDAAAAADAAQRPGISLYVSFFTRQMDIIRLAVEFEEEHCNAPEITLSGAEKRQNRHENSRFGLVSGGSAFVDLRATSAGGLRSQSGASFSALGTAKNAATRRAGAGFAFSTAARHISCVQSPQNQQGALLISALAK